MSGNPGRCGPQAGSVLGSRAMSTDPIPADSDATHAVGIDMIETDRVARVLAKHPSRFIKRVYTSEEAAFCRGRVPELAARFAAKEAVMKALGTGTRGIGWREVEVTRKRTGEPGITLHGRAIARAEKLGIDRLALSISHSRDYAVASVVSRVV